MVTIIHAADLHLGAEFSSLPEEKAAAARKISLERLAWLIARANDMTADAVLLAGDLFDRPDLSGSLAAETFAILSKSACPVLISPGNHDYYCEKSPYARYNLPACVHVFTKRNLEPFFLAGGEAAVWGAAFQSASAAIPLDADIDPRLVNICLVHGELLGDNGYNYLSSAAIAASGFDYIALGHNHSFSGVLTSGAAYYACPGAFCPADLSETGEKGFLAGSVSKGRVSLAFRRSGAVEFYQQSVSPEQLDSFLFNAEQSVNKRACLTLRLIGQSETPADEAFFKKRLEDRFFHLIIRNETKKKKDIWQYLGDDSIKGEVSRALKSQLETASSAQEQEKILLAAEYVLAALEEA